MDLSARPVLVRALPFAVYIAFLAGESLAKDHIDTRWLYAAQIAFVAALLAWFWRTYDELRGAARTPARDWLLGLAVGSTVFVLWVNLDFEWAQIGSARGVASEFASRGDEHAGLALRFAGAVLVVPVMEELFWRSFLTRWLERSDFLAVDAKAMGWRSILLASAAFGAEHHLWLAGFVGGLAYGWLYRHTGNLWTVILAHALTNILLEAWVHRTGSWHFL